MKKIYKKPAMRLEVFSLSQNVAYGCTAVGKLGSPNTLTKEQCGWETNAGIRVVLWVSEATSCAQKTNVDAEVMGVCYNAPSGSTIFYS